jgi:hypothetical protein
MAPRNPINGTTPPIAGRPLPADWQRQAQAKAAQSEAAYLSRLENAWRRPLMARSALNAFLDEMQPQSHDPRHTNDSARGDSGPNGVRLDGQMLLVGKEGEFEVWRDSVSGATVRRKLGNG